jgi:transcriptional regulator with XRE-family HTH domain
MSLTDANPLGLYLKDRRARLDPKTFGFSSARRRTPGLRREEVAQRANVSATWYTWLEQGRGGAPSSDVLDRIAQALVLSAAEREHLFLLAQGRPPEVRYQPAQGITPQLQRILDALVLSPAIVKSSTWDVVGWNQAALAVLTDYRKVPADERNVLRLFFLHPQARALQLDWESIARFMVATFRADVARAGSAERAAVLIEELSRRSADFARIWRSNSDVRNSGEGVKRLRNPVVGLLGLEYSTFAVDGHPDLGMVVYNPATPEDADKVRLLIEKRASETG